MLTAERIRACGGGEGILDLFGELGYPVHPIRVDPDEWRRAGVDIGWDAGADFRLAARLRRFDLFWLHGAADEGSVAKFLSSYHSYNILTKSAVVFCNGDERAFSVYDLSGRRLRRLDVDTASPSFHAVDRLNLLSADGAALPHVFDLALDRERLTRHFFEAFRDAARELTAALAAAAPGETASAAASEAVLVMSRLLFLCFVQEKGWLDGQPRFLFDRLHECDAFASVLLPLFFGCLNTPAAERDAPARRLGRIPYLNGGLFEPSPFERRHPRLVVPDRLVSGITRRVFERFDFCSDEGDAAGAHVDPEMLGKVFESLMESGERAATGSFYTPKPIVDALLSRAIREWVGGGSAADRLLRLGTLTVLDPACGSGAFLLAALGVVEQLARELAPEAGVELPPRLRQSIVENSLFGVDLKAEAVRLCELRLWLAIVSGSRCEIEDVPPLPNLDRNIMQGNSLLSPTDFLGSSRADVYREWVYAIRAQKDLLARYRSARRADRPALARLIRGNDVRLAADLLERAVAADEKELEAASRPERDLFGRAMSVDADRCRELQKRIESTRRMLERVEEGMLDFFSFDVHFAPVLAAGGFDVVCGNPPWVRNARIDAGTKRMLAGRYSMFRGRGRGARAGFHQPDLSVAFVERAVELTAPGGAVTMLVPAKITNAAYGAQLRTKLLEHDIVAIDDWSASSSRPFDANAFPLGLTLVKRSPRPHIEVVDGDHSFALDQRELASASEWALVPPDVAALLSRLRARHPRLEQVLRRRSMMGVKTGENRAFFLGGGTVRGSSLIVDGGIAVPLKHVARCVRGRDVRRWSARGSAWLLWPPRDGWRKPPEWLERLARSRDVGVDVYRLSFVRAEHVGIRAAWKDVSRGMSAVVLPESTAARGVRVPLVPNQTLYSIDTATLDEAHAICAILNSPVAAALLLAFATRAKDAHFRYFGRTVDAVAFPEGAAADAGRAELARLSRRAHRGEDIAAELARTSAALYGLEPSEAEVLRSFACRRLQLDAC